MTTIAALFVVLFYNGLVAASVDWKIAALYTVALIAQYLLIASAAWNYGTRFVLTVLSKESQTI